MPQSVTKTLQPDAEGNIALGDLAKGIESFNVTVDKDHRIILEPVEPFPEREKWLFENKEALKHVQQGLEDAANGKVHSRGSFAQYSDGE